MVLINKFLDELSGDEDTNTILYTAIQSTPMCMTITTSSKSSTRKRKHRLKEDNKNKNRKVNIVFCNSQLLFKYLNMVKGL